MSNECSPNFALSGLRFPAIITAIIAVCVLVELVLVASDLRIGLQVGLRGKAYQYGGLWAGLLYDWKPNYAAQPYLMFVSHAWLHAGWLHLVVNMLTLVSIGAVLVDRVGQLKFALLYAASVLGGAFGFCLITQQTDPMIGASGGLFGLVGAYVAWDYVDRFTAKRRLWPVAQLVLYLLAFNIVMWWVTDGRLAWEGHLGGFLAGWAAAALIDPRSR